MCALLHPESVAIFYQDLFVVIKKPKNKSFFSKKLVIEALAKQRILVSDWCSAGRFFDAKRRKPAWNRCTSTSHLSLCLCPLLDRDEAMRINWVRQAIMVALFLNLKTVVLIFMR